VPENVKQNSLATIYNGLCKNIQDVNRELAHYVGSDDSLVNEVNELVKAGPIPKDA